MHALLFDWKNASDIRVEIFALLHIKETLVWLRRCDPHSNWSIKQTGCRLSAKQVVYGKNSQRNKTHANTALINQTEPRLWFASPFLEELLRISDKLVTVIDVGRWSKRFWCIFMQINIDVSSVMFILPFVSQLWHPNDIFPRNHLNKFGKTH